MGPLATGIQSLVLLYQVMESRQEVSGRYYQALYTKLFDSRLKHTNKQASGGCVFRDGFLFENRGLWQRMGWPQEMGGVLYILWEVGAM